MHAWLEVHFRRHAEKRCSVAVQEERERLPVEPGKLLKLGRIDAPLARLALRDEGLRAPEVLGDLRLRQPGHLAGCSEPREQATVFRCVDGFHVSPIKGPAGRSQASIVFADHCGRAEVLPRKVREAEVADLISQPEVKRRLASRRIPHSAPRLTCGQA
jgi:hypothetical protein